MNKRNYTEELDIIRGAMVIDVLKELSRLDRTFTSKDDSPLEFFEFDNVAGDIKEIHPDGTFMFICGNDELGGNDELEEVSLWQLLDNNNINLYDVSELYNELCGL
jgi:hypothetical protein